MSYAIIAPGQFETNSGVRISQYGLIDYVSDFGEALAVRYCEDLGMISMYSQSVDLSYRFLIEGDSGLSPRVNIPGVMRAINQAFRVAKGKEPLTAHEISAILPTVSIDTVKLLMNFVRTNGQIDRQEARLQGRNRYATDEQRTYAWVQERGKCAYCHTVTKPFAKSTASDKLHIDHIEPFDGQNTVVSNLACACRACHLDKLRTPALEFLESVQLWQLP